jgi:hypothetical protein
VCSELSLSIPGSRLGVRGVVLRITHSAWTARTLDFHAVSMQPKYLSQHGIMLTYQTGLAGISKSLPYALQGRLRRYMFTKYSC